MHENEIDTFRKTKNLKTLSNQHFLTKGNSKRYPLCRSKITSDIRFAMSEILSKYTGKQDCLK